MPNVTRSDVPESPFVWTRGVASREALRYLDRNGISAEPLLANAGLSRDQLLRGEGGISVASQYRFLELAAAETNNSLLGFHPRGRNGSARGRRPLLPRRLFGDGLGSGRKPGAVCWNDE